LAGSRSWQSASFPGSEVMPRAFLRVISRALRAARGRCGLHHLADDDFCLPGFSSSQAFRAS